MVNDMLVWCTFRSVFALFCLLIAALFNHCLLVVKLIFVGVYIMLYAYKGDVSFLKRFS